MPSASARFAVFSRPVLLLGGRTDLYLKDLHVFDPITVKWTELHPTGSSPPPRGGMGFAATPDGKLYVYGGSQRQDYYAYNSVEVAAGTIIFIIRNIICP